MIKIEYDNSVQAAEEASETDAEKAEELEEQNNEKYYNIISEIYIH